ncbi:hypothetical protein LJY25_14950 [Hymenobacter sp. BT175]|uniref:hypothetical protein n=1 Tax=Hymenobacter translucens TaxID=2886507 RepID=UPI001D0DFF00|nr:hypothetical protein [Hymenobacter translucens]MCC2547748.1 hypothetical protein [Hymenobacter translucens]
MSDAPESPIAALYAAAEAVRQQLQLATYDEAAVQRLAGFIEEQRPLLKPDNHESVATALGCFLGQCMVQVFGGEWAAGPDGSTGVGIQGKHFFNPFYRVAEQLARGEKESVAMFFAGIPARLAAPQGRKGWIPG